MLTKEMSRDERRQWAEARGSAIQRRPRPKSTALKFASPAAPSNIGSDIRSALESAGHLDRLTGRCRNYLGFLNRPQRHDAEAITDLLSEILTEESVQNVRRKQTLLVSREWLAEIVTAAIQADAESRPLKVSGNSGSLPIVSDVGTRLQRALIESFMQPGDKAYRFSCGSCVRFLNALNQTTEHDPDKITDGLLVTLQMPPWKREKVGGTKEQRVWLRAIVAEVIESIGPS